MDLYSYEDEVYENISIFISRTDGSAQALRRMNF